MSTHAHPETTLVETTDTEAAAPVVPTKVARRRRRGPVALEQEADRAADDLLAGAAGLARRLGRAQPSRIDLPASRGRALDSGLRTRLEHGFGADLSRVRIHDDAAAHQLVGAEGADALTAGPDIFFAPSAFRPDGDEGLRLLAHEVAHALQQTGRAATDQRWRVTDVHGRGPVQAQDRFLDRFTPGGGAAAATPEQKFEQVALDHGGVASGSPIAVYYTVLAATLGARIDPADEAFTRFARQAKAGAHGATSVQERSYLLDVLKVGLAWDPAASLIEDSDEVLHTAGASTTFAAWLQSGGRGVSWPAGVVNDVPALRSYRDYMYGAFRIFLVRPDARPYTLSEERRRAMYERADWTTTLHPNERVVLAANRLEYLEALRFAVCREAEEWSGVDVLVETEAERGFVANAVFRAQRRLRLLAPRLEAWARQADTEGEALQQRAVAWFAERHAAAVEFWDGAIRRWTSEVARRGRAGRFDVGEELRAELAVDLDVNPTVQGAARRLARGLVAFLRPERTDVDAPGAYAARRDALVDLVGREIQTVSADLSRFRLDEATLARAELVPWMVLRLELLRQALLSYISGDDTSSYDDTRQGHRLGIATHARVLAVELGDPELEAEALAVLRNEAGGVTRLVLSSDWRRPARSDLSQLQKDFSEGLLYSENLVLDARAVKLFYDEAYMARLANAIELMLEPDVAPVMENRLVLQEAGRAADRAPTAARWVVDDTDWAPHPDETRTVQELISSHPKSQVQLPEEDRDTAIAYPGQEVVADLANAPRLGSEIFAWELPAWDRLAAQMAAALHELPYLADEVGPVVDPIAWLNAASALIGAEGGPTSAEVRRRIWQHMYDRALAQRRRLGTNRMAPGLLRRATTHDRGVVAARIADLLADYDGTVGGWQLPTDALDLITQFHRYAAPATDNVAQTAALMVEIAGTLRRAFRREAFFGTVVIEEQRYDVITGYYGFLVLAEHWLTDPGNRRDLTTNFLALSSEEITQARDDLRAVREGFDSVRARIQRDRGFEVTASGALRSLNYPFLITSDQQFGWNGSVVQFSRVFTRFRYHPPYGYRGTEIGGVEAGAHSNALVIDPETNEPIPAGTDLLEIRINEHPHILKAPAFDGSADSQAALATLDTLWRAVEDQAFVLSMQNLEEAIESLAMLALDAAELVPGAGQVLAVGRIVVAVTTFLASADFEDITAVLSGEVIEQIEGVVEEITAMMSPDQLWMFLLFDLDTSILDRIRRRNADSARSRRISRRGGRFGKIMRGLGRLGSMLAIQLERMHERVQPPLRTTQAFVVSHPVVGWAVDLAAEAVIVGAALIDDLDELADVQNVEEQLSQRIQALVDAIEGFELPRELIPIDLLVSAILSLILDRFGAKGRLVEAALRTTGALDEIGGLVADELDDLGVNPNDAWLGVGRWEGEGVKPLVDDALTAARRELLDGIYGALALVGLEELARPENRPVATAADPDALESTGGAAAPALSAGHEGRLPAVAAPSGDVIPPGPGAALPKGVRHRAERELGQPFGHVRLHRRPIGDGVDALTRGSHVVMRPGLSLDGGRGAEVLRHELGHVVRHTRGDSRLPTKGRPGTAVRFDPVAEAAADHATLGGTATDHHVDDGAAAPALSPEVLSRLLHRLADYSDLRDFQRDIHDPTTSLPGLTTEQSRHIANFKEKLVAALRANTLRVSGVPPDRSGRFDTEQLVRHHAKLAGDKIHELARGDRNGVERLAQRSLREVRQRRPQGGVQPREFRLVPSDLRRLTEGYLLIRTGLLCEVRLPRGLEAFEREMTGDEPLDVRVTGLFMGAITRASQLWHPILEGQLAVGRTLEGGEVPGQARNRFRIADADAQTEIYQALVARIRAFGPRRRVLKRGRYEIVDDLVEEAVDQRALGTQVEPGQLPTPDEYLETTPGSRRRGTISGGAEVALRIGTHGRLTTAGTSTFSTLDRESHHTTQYLFAEYLTNRVTARRPFTLDDEPGLEMEGSRPHRLHRADGDDPIRLGDLHGRDDHRGDPMPSILLAAPTHQRGKLHVNKSVPDEPAGRQGSGRRDTAAAQSATVESWFRSKSPRTRATDAAAPPGTPPSTVASMPEPARRRNAELVAGVEEIYTEMRRMMMAALERGLIEHEKPYYETIAAREPRHLDEDGELAEDWTLDEGHLRRVFAVARQNNDEVMSRYGVRVSP